MAVLPMLDGRDDARQLVQALVIRPHLQKESEKDDQDERKRVNLNQLRLKRMQRMAKLHTNGNLCQNALHPLRGYYMTEQISLLSAALSILTFFLAKAHTMGGRARLRYNIKLILGRGVKNAEDIAFSLPAWDPLKEGDRLPRYTKFLHAECERPLHGPDSTYARSDVESAMRISSVIAKELKEQRPVAILPDNQPLDEGKAYFFIGAPTVNSHARNLFPSLQQSRIFEIVETPETRDSGESFFFRHRQSGQEFHSNGEFGYALVYCQKNPDFNRFFLFGQHESGTLAAAQCFIEHYYNLRYYRTDLEVLLKVRKGSLCCVYEKACPVKEPSVSLRGKFLDWIFNARQIS